MKKIYYSLSIALILSASLIAQPCLQNQIKISTQNQMDALGGCSYINGDIEISGTVTNLRSLSSVSSIYGDLVIKDNEVKDLYGLENLTNVSGSVIINSNQKLTSLSYLYNLNSIGEALVIENNNNLESLTGLERLYLNNGEQDVYIVNNNSLSNLKGLSGVTNINNLKLYDNYALKNCTGLTNLSRANFIEAKRNFALENFSGLQKLTYLRSLSVEKNRSLVNFNGLDNLETIEGWFFVDDNNELLNFEGLGSLKRINSSFQVKDNNKLRSFHGLDELESVKKNLTINSNNELRNLRGLLSLKSINGELNIYSNSLISSITALRNLEVVDGDLIISDNPNLKSLSGIDNIDYRGIDKLEITSCYNLNACQVGSVCDFITNKTNYKISDNAYDCSTIGRVVSNCATKPLTPPNNVGINQNLNAYDVNIMKYNDLLKVEVKSKRPENDGNTIYYNLVDYTGYSAKQGEAVNQFEINLSSLQNNLYYLFIQDHVTNFVYVEKIVVKN